MSLLLLHAAFAIPGRFGFARGFRHGRRDLFVDPFNEPMHQRCFVDGACLFQEAKKFSHRQEWKRQTVCFLAVLTIRRQMVQVQHFAIAAPNFRNAKCRVDAHAIKGTAGDLDFQREIICAKTHLGSSVYQPRQAFGSKLQLSACANKRQSQRTNA